MGRIAHPDEIGISPPEMDPAVGSGAAVPG
jgi:hypothetical protein